MTKEGHFLATDGRKSKYNSHESHKKHKKSKSLMKKPTYLVREDMSSVREQLKSPVSENQSPVKVTNGTCQKRQRDSNEQEKRKTLRPSEEVFNLYFSHRQMIMIQNLTGSQRVCKA